MNIDRRLLLQAWFVKGTFFIIIGLGIFGAFLTVLQARLLSIIIHKVFLLHQGLNDLIIWLVIVLIVMLLKSGTTFGSEVSSGVIAIHVKANLRQLLVEHILNLGPINNKDKQSGEQVATVLQGVEALDVYFSQYLPQIIFSTFVPLIILLMVFPIDSLSGIILLITIPLLPLFLYLIGISFETLTHRRWLVLRLLSAFLLDSLQGITTLKILNQSHAYISKIAKISEQYRQSTMVVLQATFLSALVMEFISTISIALVAVQIGLRLLYGKIGFEDAYFILLIAPEFYMPIRQLGMRFHAGMSGVSAAQSIFTILEQPSSDTETVVGKTNSKQKRKTYWKFDEEDEDEDVDIDINIVSMQYLSSLTAHPYCIDFNNVSYRYPEDTNDSVSDVSLTLFSGQLTALVGMSGSGKTTIIRLLARIIDPRCGVIMINDKPLMELSPDIWRKYISWVPQHPFLFNDTISENIRFGYSDATSEQIQEAAKYAYLEEKIQSLPLGYETIIGENGTILSAGERQRLALARAFIKNAPIVIMDEPIEHIDPQQEEIFRQSVSQLYQGRTVILIAHYIPTIKQAERIIVLDKGRVIETGSHSELLQKQGKYQQLVGQWIKA